MALLTMLAWRRRGRAALRRPAVSLLFVFAAIGLIPAPRAADYTPSPEYQLKAVFLFNFAQFVEWPPRAFSEPATPLVIGILGDDPFGAYLDNLVKGEKVDGHPLVIRRYRRTEDMTEAHILFISRSEARYLQESIASLKSRSVLTVSDLDTFTREGGIVRFVTEGGKIGLRINVEAAKACNLTISSKILRPATIVKPGKD